MTAVEQLDYVQKYLEQLYQPDQQYHLYSMRFTRLLAPYAKARHLSGDPAQIGP